MRCDRRELSLLLCYISTIFGTAGLCGHYGHFDHRGDDDNDFGNFILLLLVFVPTFCIYAATILLYWMLRRSRMDRRNKLWFGILCLVVVVGYCLVILIGFIIDGDDSFGWFWFFIFMTALIMACAGVLVCLEKSVQIS